MEHLLSDIMDSFDFRKGADGEKQEKLWPKNDSSDERSYKLNQLQGFPLL